MSVRSACMILVMSVVFTIPALLLTISRRTAMPESSAWGEINEPPRFGETIASVLQIRRARRTVKLKPSWFALSSSAYSQWALWLLVQRAVEFDYINKITYETVRRD